MAQTVLTLLFGVFVTWPAAAAQFCQIAIDKQNPRRVDIQFPGKTITVVGHLRPSHRDDQGNTLETYLWKAFNDPNLYEQVKYSDKYSTMTPEGKKIQNRIQLFLQKDAQAVEQWSEDLEIVKRALRNNTHQIFAVERAASPSMVAQSNEVTARNALVAATNGSMLLNEIQINGLAEREQIMSVALTPVLYLANQGSDVFGSSRAITVAHGEWEVTAKQLAAETQSSLLLIDSSFLAAQTALLKQECLMQNSARRVRRAHQPPVTASR